MLPELLAEIAQFLVGERLERRGVEDLLAVGEGPVDGVLPRPGSCPIQWGPDDNGMPLVQSIDGLQLEVIQREGKMPAGSSGWPFSAGRSGAVDVMPWKDNRPTKSDRQPLERFNSLKIHDNIDLLTVLSSSPVVLCGSTS